MTDGHVRREFLLTAAVAALAAPLLSLSSGAPRTAPDTGGRAGGPLLTLASAVKHLEARFYGAAAGERGAGAISFSDAATGRHVREIAADKREHLAVLHTLAAGASAPAIDLSAGPQTPFSRVARSVGLIRPGAAFDPYADGVSFLLGSLMLEGMCAATYRCLQWRGGTAFAPLVADATYHRGLVGSILDAHSVAEAAVGAAAGRISAVYDAPRTMRPNLREAYAALGLDRRTARGGFFPAGLESAGLAPA